MSQNPNLSRVRFLHTSDWQLGATRSFLNDDAQARWVAARFDAVRAIGQLASQNYCEFVIVAGDVFESNQVDRRTILRACEALASITVPVFLLPGNHDPFDGGTVFNSATWKANKPQHVRVLSPEQRVAEARGAVEVIGVPWVTKRPLSDLVAEALDGLSLTDDRVRIMVAHGRVDALSPDPRDPALISVERAEAAISEGRIHYLALGDRHSLTEIGSTGRIRYSGTPEVCAFDEVDPGHVLIVELNPTEASVVPADTGTWRFSEKTFEINGDADITALEQALASIANKERGVLRLSYLGSLTLRDHARLVHVVERAKDLFAGIHEPRLSSRLKILPSEGDFDDLSLSGFASSAAAKLRAMATGDGPDSETARDALSLLIRLAEMPD